MPSTSKPGGGCGVAGLAAAAVEVLTTIASWYEVGWKDYSKECEKAVKAGPMKLHGIIVGTNFVPYFVLEMMGISLPMIGFSSLDTSTVYSGSMAR